MGTDSEWREQFMNIGKNPWELERKPVPDEPEADPSPNTGNNWHLNTTTPSDSSAAERARNMTVLDNEAIELEFVSVLLYYTYIKESKREESMMCRNDKSRVGPKWKTQHIPTVQPYVYTPSFYLHTWDIPCNMWDLTCFLMEGNSI